MLDIEAFPPGFEACDELRSAFMRALILRLIESPEASLAPCASTLQESVPRTLIRYWHDPDDLPDDVQNCLASWSPLSDMGVELRLFCDASAAAYITTHYGAREREAFSRCRHPAMRSDYLRLCYVLEEGGLYVDVDDVLLCHANDLFGGHILRLQPLCYDIDTGQMVPAHDIWRADLPTRGRIFYVNNNPIVSPPGHPVLRKALARATDRLLSGGPPPEIQSTTGPGNLTAVLAAHARDLIAAGEALDFELLRDWDSVAKTHWDLAYRNDERNWRNMSVS